MSQSCPLLHRFSGPSFGSIHMESQQGNELRVPFKSQMKFNPQNARHSGAVED
jgi:hypothetical protein